MTVRHNSNEAECIHMYIRDKRVLVHTGTCTDQLLKYNAAKTFVRANAFLICHLDTATHACVQ